MRSPNDIEPKRRLATRLRRCAWALSTLFLACSVAPRRATPVRAEVRAEHRAPLGIAVRQPCPPGAVLVTGDYCPKVEQHCLHWLDEPVLPFARCGEYATPTRCLSARVPLRYCIDAYEYTEPGQPLPRGSASFNEASRVCAELGRRVCSEAEWNFACEGEQMLPYPYGFSRSPVCNQDRAPLVKVGPKRTVLLDWREPSSARPECVSPFGVFNMVGNLDEPVLREMPPADPRFRSALKGGWWLPGRNRCRPATVGHDVDYAGLQVGIRCCATAE